MNKDRERLISSIRKNAMKAGLSPDQYELDFVKGEDGKLYVRKEKGDDVVLIPVESLEDVS